eukprot:9355050-Alexandrium_andersonii.AAC.1
MCRVGECKCKVSLARAWGPLTTHTVETQDTATASSVFPPDAAHTVGEKLMPEGCLALVALELDRPAKTRVTRLELTDSTR